MRIPTLALSVAPVWMGVEAALYEFRARDISASSGTTVAVAFLCLGVALFLQIAANFANDYSDGVHGADANRGANSGVIESIDIDVAAENGYTREEIDEVLQRAAPTRLVASGVPPKHVLIAAIVNAVLACACGIAVCVLTGHWWLILVGAMCVAAAWFYVGGPKPYGYMGFGELVAFVFFGLVATLGTQYALCGTITGYGWYGAAVIGLVAAIVLSITNLRDIHTDAAAGKRTLEVRIGERASTVMICVAIGVVLLAMLIPWSVLWITIDSSLENLTIISGYAATLGSIVLILISVVAILDVAHHRFRNAMKNMLWIALAVALVYFGMMMSL